MAIFYTVDRSKQLVEGLKLELDNNYEAMRIFQVENICSAQETKGRLKQLYPDGISRHGIKYLTDCTVLCDQFGVPLDVAPFSPMIESVFEVMRQAEFPNRPSRMQSIYGWTNEEDAQEFAEGKFPIYEIESANAFIADQKYLTLGACVAGSYELARKYWEGEHSNNPKLEVLIPLPVVVGRAI